MAGVFPILSDGQVVRYAVQSTTEWSVRVNVFVNFSEQRWVNRQPLRKFVFQYRDISRADVATLKAFFDAQQGMFDTFEITFDGDTFTFMSFDQDEFRATEDKMPNRFSVNLKLKQTRPNGWFYIPQTLTPVYPFINFGVITQKPWFAERSFFTSKIDLESGTRYAFPWRDTPIRSWEINYPTIEMQEGYSIGLFFEQMHGRFGTFAFHDPELYAIARATPFTEASPDPNYQAIPNCRFNMDEFTLEYLGPNQCAAKVLIIEAIPSGPVVPAATPVSAVITVWSELLKNPGDTIAVGIAGQVIGDINNPFSAGSQIVNTAVGYALRADTLAIDPATWSKAVSIFMYSSGAPPDGTDTYVPTPQLNIYDMYMDVVYSDLTTARIRPRVAVLAPGFTTGATVDNAPLAYDVDSLPPTTFATYSRAVFSGDSFGNSMSEILEYAVWV